MAKKVLVVDDEGFFAENAAVVIRQAGFEVTVAKSYTKAIQALEQQPYDIVTLDIMMRISQDEQVNLDAAILDATKLGRKTGLVLFEQIRQRWPQSKIVIVSVLGATDPQLCTLLNKGVTVLAKPISVAKLVGAVNSAAE